MMSGSLTFQGLLFFLNAGFALALLVGYRTRLVTVVCWVFLISLHSRNPLVLNGGDIYFRMVLFWAMFLPWGEIWSVDSRLQPGCRSTPLRQLNLATAGYVLQICLVYWFAAIPKFDPVWVVDYEASYFALMLDQFTKPLGHWMLGFPEALRWLTYSVWWFEALGPFLLLAPVLRGPLRTVGVLGLAGLHLGFLTSMKLGLFGYIGVASVLGLLPSWFWDKLLGGRFGEGADFWQKLADRFPSFGRPREQAYGLHPGFEVLLGCLLVFIFIWNFGNEGTTPRMSVPPNRQWPAQLLRIDQRWNMFSPKPLMDDGWFVVEGHKVNGETLNLFGGGPVVWDKPEDVSTTYPNQRWRKYLMNLWELVHEKQRLYYGKYLCRLYNTGRPSEEQVARFEIYYLREVTLPGYRLPEPEKVLLWKHFCFDTPFQLEP